MSDVVSRVYSGFRGVDFRGEEINLMRSSDCLNVWKDYRKTDSIETRPKLKLNKEFEDTIYGIFFYNNRMIVHCGASLYRQNDDGSFVSMGIEVNKAKSDAFVYNNCWYFKDGKNYLQYDGATIKAVEGYVPTTVIGKLPKSGGTTNEDVNLLTNRRITTYRGDGKSVVYWLDVPFEIDNVDDIRPVVVQVNGVTLSEEEYEIVKENSEDNIKRWKVKFNEPPLESGADNVSIECTYPVEGNRKKIEECTLLQVFDNRVFFSGNPNYPNKIWHCSLNNPSYCSDLDEYNEGLDTAAVKGMVAGNNALWVFKEPSQANTTVFYHTPTIDADYGKIYPNTHSSIATGCVGRAINFNDDIVFFSDRGMEGINGDVTSEQVVAHRSSLVDRKLIAEDGYKDMLLEEWNGYLLVIIGNKVYLADSRAMFTNETHYEYEWFYWELPAEITCTRVDKGVLYLGTANGVYTLTETGEESDVASYWVTAKDKFNYPQYLKTTNKRGCVIEATGDVTVSVKTDKSKEWEVIGEYPDTTDYFVSRIKRKKFKDIQLKFSSTTSFGLEAATLECFIGGYIKQR